MAMERRTIQEVGGGTVTVSLPHEWAAEHDIEAGRDVCLWPHRDGSIVVRPDPSETTPLATATLDLAGVDPAAVPGLLRAAYVAGYDEIHLEHEPGWEPGLRRQIRETVRSLVGVDLISETEGTIVVADLLDPAAVSVEQSIRQLRHTITAMQEGVLAILEGRTETAAPVTERVAECERTVRHLDRRFNRSLRDLDEMDALGVDRYRLAGFVQLARQLGQVASHLATVARTATGLDPAGNAVETVRPQVETIGHLLADSSTAALNGPSVSNVEAVFGNVERSREALQAAIADLDGPARTRVDPLRSALERVLDAVAEIAGVALQLGLDD